MALCYSRGMGSTGQNWISRKLESFSLLICRWTGGSGAFGLACAVIVVWLISGPVFGYSDTWQLVINTGTTIVTFLMVFLIQNAQNRDTQAIQLKLDELIRATEGAHNRLIALESQGEETLEEVRAELADACMMADGTGRNLSSDRGE